MCGRFTPVTFEGAERVACVLGRRGGEDAEGGGVPNEGEAAEGVPNEGEAAEGVPNEGEGELGIERPTRLPHDAFPRRVVPVICADATWQEKFHVQSLTWGYIPQGCSDLVFNTRIETAWELPLWRESMAERHCIVAAWAFFERHRTQRGLNPSTRRWEKQLIRFASPEERPMLLGGIWEEGRFSVLTTKPNAAVKSTHDRMPLVLSAGEARLWLRAVDGARGEAGDARASAGHALLERLADRSCIQFVADPVYPTGEQDDQLSLF